MVAAMPLQNDARPSEKTVTLRDLRRVAFGLSAAIMIVMIAGAINDDSGSSTATAELGEEQTVSYVFSINSGQSANIAENYAATTAVMTVAVTDGPATGCSIASGATDVDSDGNAPFAISSTCAITVNDAGDLDFEDDDNSFTLSILANNGNGEADVGSVTISVTDVNDITPVYQAADADDAISVNENVGTGSIDAGSITDADTVGTYGCTLGGADAADFACSISGSTVNVAFASSPDYENPADADTNNVYVVTVLIDDGTNDDANGATTLTITVGDLNDEAPVFTSSATVTTNEGSTAVVSLTATDGDAADSGGVDFAITTNDNNLFAINGAGVITFSAAPNFEAPGCGAGSNSNTCTIIVSATDAADTATSQTITVTVADVNDITPVYQAADADDAISVNENVGTGSIDAGTITDADTVGTYGCTLGGADAADFACSISGSTVNIAFAADPNYESPADADTNNVYIVTVLIDDGVADDANGATTLTITVVTLTISLLHTQLHQLHRQLPKVQLQWILTLPLLTQIPVTQILVILEVLMQVRLRVL